MLKAKCICPPGEPQQACPIHGWQKLPQARQHIGNENPSTLDEYHRLKTMFPEMTQRKFAQHIGVPSGGDETMLGPDPEAPEMPGHDVPGVS